MATPTKTTKSTPSASVKATQTALNKAGANLKVDGILGPKTIAAQQQYGSTATSSTSKSAPTSTNKSTPAIKVSSGGKSSGSRVSAPVATSSTKPSKFGNPFEGGFLNNFKTGVKDAINNVKKIASTQPASAALSGKLLDGYTDSNGVFHSTQLNPAGTYETPSFGSKITGGPLQAPTVGTAEKPTVANNQPTALDAEGNYYTTTGGPVSNPDGTTMNIQNVQSGTTSTPALTPTPTTSGPINTKITTPLADGSTQVSSFSESPAPSPTVNINTQASSAVLGLVDDFMKTGGAATWASDKGEYQNNETLKLESNIAKQFSDPNDVTSQYNSNPAFKASIDKAASKAGKTPQEMIGSISAKTTTAINGVLPPQTVPEYLKNVSGIAPEMTKELNRQIAEDTRYTQAQKDILFGKKDEFGEDIIKGIAQKQKEDADRAVDFYERQLARQEKTIREKAQLEIDKKKAEFEREDADIELKRVQAKENLVNFLAHIGALNTDGNALLGIEKLEQAYQAQRQQLRQSFQFAERSITTDMNERMGELQDNVDEKKFKLSQDLSKTEREVIMEGMKLDHDYNKDMSNIRLKYSSEIQDAKDKATTKANSYSNAYNDALIKLTTGNNAIPLNIAKGMIDARGNVIPSQENVDTINQYSKKDSDITDTTMQKVRQYLKQENGKDIASYEEDLKAFNSDAEFRNSILGSLE